MLQEIQYQDLLLEDKNGVRFRLGNTHLSVMPEAAARQAGMLIEDANCWPEDIPQIIAGDFNCDVHSRAMRQLLSCFRDSHAEATGVFDERFTYHGFCGEKYLPDPAFPFTVKIDWILLKGNVSCR